MKSLLKLQCRNKILKMLHIKLIGVEALVILWGVGSGVCMMRPLWARIECVTPDKTLWVGREPVNPLNHTFSYIPKEHFTLELWWKVERQNEFWEYIHKVGNPGESIGGSFSFLVLHSLVYPSLLICLYKSDMTIGDEWGWTDLIWIWVVG